MKNKFNIKYDKKDVCFLKKLIVIIILSFSLISIAIGMYEKALLFISVPFMLIIILYVISVFLEAKWYLKRLKQYGFCVPDHKEDVINGLFGLLRNKNCEYKNLSYAGQRIILTILSVFLVIGIIYASSKARTPHYITILISVLLMLYYIVQIPNRWFRDDVDIFRNNNRFIRKNIPISVVRLVILFILFYLFGIFAMDQLPATNGHYYKRIMEYNVNHNILAFDYFPTEIPDDASEIKFISDAEKCRVSFCTTKEEAEKYVSYFQEEVGLKHVYTFQTDKNYEEYLENAKGRLIESANINEKCMLITGDDELFWVCINVDMGFVSFGY